MSRRLAALVSAVVMVGAGLWGAGAEAAPHLVVDMASGKVISRQQEFDRWYPASLTKMMTVYTVFDLVKKGRISLLSPVRVSSRAAAEQPSKMGFKPGTILTFDAAVKILMVKSANDIATATAESAAGSVEAFASLMNANARRLGMTASHFVNAHGLHDPDQFTTARDLAVLAVALRRDYPAYAGYFSIKALQHGGKVIGNHNPLLTRMDGATGFKTGYTCAAGLNIVGGARKGNRELIAVVLGGPSGRERNVRTARLLTDGFKTQPMFLSPRLQTLRPNTTVRYTPVDMRPITCGADKPAVQLDEEGDDLPEGAGPTLVELEQRYLRPKNRNYGQPVPIALGGATGPDPFGLLPRPDLQADPAAAVAAVAPDLPDAKPVQRPVTASAFAAESKPRRVKTTGRTARKR